MKKEDQIKAVLVAWLSVILKMAIAYIVIAMFVSELNPVKWGMFTKVIALIATLVIIDEEVNL